MDKQYVVIVGNLVDGILSTHGPFEDKDHANQWASINVGKQEYYILPIQR